MPKKKQGVDKMKEFDECISDIHKEVLKLSQTHNTNVVMSAMLEISLRMILLSMGTSGLLRLFSGSVANVSMYGPLIDEMLRVGDRVDPLNFKEFQNLKLVPDEETVH